MENVISVPDTLTTAHSAVKDTWLSGNKNSLNFLLWFCITILDLSIKYPYFKEHQQMNIYVIIENIKMQRVLRNPSFIQPSSIFQRFD